MAVSESSVQQVGNDDWQADSGHCRDSSVLHKMITQGTLPHKNLACLMHGRHRQSFASSSLLSTQFSGHFLADLSHLAQISVR